MMDRGTEQALIEELICLKQGGKAFLDDGIAHSSVARYASASFFERERASILRRMPIMAALASELPRPNSFLCRQVSGLPVLFVRDSDNAVHAYLNVCRHRGTRLVWEESGCKRRFVCPYHAWTWDNRGNLKGVPHEEQGFPNLDREQFGLRRLACVERHGWIWVATPEAGDIDLEAHLGELAQDLDWLDAGGLEVRHTYDQVHQVNWKLIIEGGIEAYHFQIAHKQTIAPYFEDNLSSYRTFGRHIRSVLPRRSMETLGRDDPSSWVIRDHANLLYSVFPTSQLLVQQDHIVWIALEPLAADRTRIRLSTLAPAVGANGAETDDRHWRKNHDITVRTLSEDFEIGESIQSGLLSGANEALHFGRFEGALEAFNRSVDDCVGSAALG